MIYFLIFLPLFVIFFSKENIVVGTASCISTIATMVLIHSIMFGDIPNNIANAVVLLFGLPVVVATQYVLQQK